MQNKSLKLTILSFVTLLVVAMLAFLGFGGIFKVKAVTDMKEMKAHIITVENTSNTILSSKEVEISGSDTTILLDSYTELVGATISQDGSTLTYNNGSITTTAPIDNGKFEITMSDGTVGVAYKSNYLDKVIWFKKNSLTLNLYDITSQGFKYDLNDQTITVPTDIRSLTELNIENSDFTTFGQSNTLSGTITDYDQTSKTATWTSTEKFASHQAVQINIGSIKETQYDIDSTYQFMYLNGLDEENRIDGFGRYEISGLGSWYYKEYHGIPYSIADECGLSPKAKTKKRYGSEDYLNSLEGAYSLAVKYRNQKGYNEIASFDFYLVTSNTYANTDELLTFFNTKDASATANNEYYHYFSHNNLNNSKNLDTKNALILKNVEYKENSLFEKGTNTPLDNQTKSEIGDFFWLTLNGVRGLAFYDSTIKQWVFSDRLLYPTISFNPEKYEIDYSRVWYNFSESGEFVFSVTNQLYGLMEIYVTNSVGERELKTSFEVSRKTNELQQDYKYNLSSYGYLQNVKVTYTADSESHIVEISGKEYILENNKIVTNDSNKTELTNYSFKTTNAGYLTSVEVTYFAVNELVTIDDKNYYYNKVENKICVYNLDAPFIAKYTFEEFGEYTFSQQYKIKKDNSTYYVTKNINSSTSISDKIDVLEITGYQATYKKDGTTSSYLRNENYVSDFSYLLENPIYTVVNTESPTAIKQPDDTAISYSKVDGYIKIGEQYFYIDETKLTTTNQAPVSLRYNATPNSNEKTSWYIRIDSNGNIQENLKYTNSKTFSSAGLYVLFLSHKDISQDNGYSEQIIAFKITNSQPEVSIQTTELNDLSSLTEKGTNDLPSNSYTNKNVFIEWLNNDVFNANIYATYTMFDFSGKIVPGKQNVPLNGLVYFKDGTIKPSTQNTTLFGENGKYVVKIYYTNTGSSISRSFVIDKTEISGITAVQVNYDGKIFGSETEGSSYSDAILSSLTNFNLTVNKPFAWTWNSKTSGAEIYAKYYYANISSKSNYVLDNVITNGENWVFANGEFGELLIGTDYPQQLIQTSNSSEANYWTDVTFSNSQMISTNCLAILVLEDEAGNTSSFVTIYDTVSPQIIQQKAGKSEKTTSSLISGTTEFTWGSHKALSVSSGNGTLNLENILNALSATPDTQIGQNTYKELTINGKTYYLNKLVSNNLFETFKTYDTNLYYTSTIKDVSISLTYSGGTTTIPTIHPIKVGTIWNRTSAYVVIEQTNNIYYTYISYNESGSALNEKISLKEYSNIQFELSVFDENGQQNFVNKNISLDQSDGRIFSHTGTPNISSIVDTTQTIDALERQLANRQQVFIDYSTNRDYLTFSFLQSSGIFEVESITLKYYELPKTPQKTRAFTISENEVVIDDITYVYVNNEFVTDDEKHTKLEGQYDFDGTTLTLVNSNYPYNARPITYTLYNINGTNMVKNLTWTECSGEETGYSGTYYQSSAINLTSNGLTAAGKYVFERKYSVDIDAEEYKSQNKGDSTNYSYTVYVDRNGVITDDLKLKLGQQSISSNYSENEAYKEFSSFGNQKNSQLYFRSYFKSTKDFDENKTNISTDMLPTKISLEIIDDIARKYYFDFNGTTIYNSNPNSKLLVIVQRYVNGINKEQTLYSSALTRVHNPSDYQKSAPISTLNSKSFSAEGIYRVIITDLSNLNINLQDSEFEAGWSTKLDLWDKNIYNSNFTPNVAIFSFKIRKEEISTSALIKNAGVETYTNLAISNLSSLDDDLDPSNDDYYYTQNNSIIFSFSDTIDEYKAKVAYKDWILVRTVYRLQNGVMTPQYETPIVPSTFEDLEIRTYDESEGADNSIFSETELARINGTYSGPQITTLTFSTKEQDGGILYYRVKYAGLSDNRYTYYIILPSTNTTSDINDCAYTLTLNYLGEQSYYGSTYSKTIKAYIDKTSPYKNLLNLIKTDAYMTEEQKIDMISNFNNFDYEFLTYYAFAVGTSFNITKVDDSEGLDYYYYKEVSNKYDGTTNPNQVVIPESSNYNKYINNRFSENLDRNYYGTPITKSGYYDIIEVDKAGNHRVYTIYINGSDGGIKLQTQSTDAKENEYEHKFITSFNGSNPTYKVITKNIQTGEETEQDYTNSETLPSISAFSFNLSSLEIKDAWYTINYRIVNGSSSASWNTIVVAPQIYSNITGITYNTIEQNIEILNNFINEAIETGKMTTGSKLEIMFVNRGGINLRFYLLTPGQSLSMSNLSPTIVGTRYFNITIPNNTYSTVFSDFKITQNSIRLSSDFSSPAISLNTIETLVQTNPVLLRFILGNYRYSISFSDNFQRSYEFIYPTTENIVNELVFEEGSTPIYYNGMLYTSNTTTFNYTTGSRDRISIKITDLNTNQTIINFVNLPYNSGTENLKTQIASKTLTDEDVQNYITESINLSTSVVSITFKALKNRHLYYEISLLDIDNNTSTHNFAIYNYAPNILLTDSVGIEIFNQDTLDKVTSKTVIVRYTTGSSVLFNPIVKLYDGQSTNSISSNTQIKNAGDYSISIVNDLGTMNIYTINFTIKPATSDIYAIYFGEDLLSAHTVKYNYKSTGSSKLIDSFFFLSNSNNAWNDIKILPSEDKDLITEEIESIGNTKIYRIYGSVYENYFAITQIYPVANNNLTTFAIYTTTDLIEYSASSVGSSDYQYTIYPEHGKATFSKVSWINSEAGFMNFVYAYVIYNDTIVLGRYDDSFVLTKSGKYTIQIFDIVGQTHKFGSQTSFTLILLNDINYYINGASPIENATYNNAVTLSLTNTSSYDWKSGGFIKVLRNNKEYSNFETSSLNWTFSEGGYYSIYIQTPIYTNTTTPITISANLHFTILDSNESKAVYDFAKISGYSVSKVERIDYNSDFADLINLIKTNYEQIVQDSSYSEQVMNSVRELNSSLLVQNNITNITELYNYLMKTDVNELLYNYVDVTDVLKTFFDVDALQSFQITPDNLGVGRYKITVKVEASDLTVAQTYSYNVWINNEAPTINASRAFGSSSTKNFTISYNPSIIYSQVGNSYITVNDQIVEHITSQSMQENSVKTYRVTEPGTYLVQVYSQSGTLISSQRITIDTPLNTAAIILIVVAVLVVIGIITVFILLRTKMKVK